MMFQTTVAMSALLCGMVKGQQITFQSTVGESPEASHWAWECVSQPIWECYEIHPNQDLTFNFDINRGKQGKSLNNIRMRSSVEINGETEHRVDKPLIFSVGNAYRSITFTPEQRSNGWFSAWSWENSGS